jgi:hypothetical protein
LGEEILMMNILIVLTFVMTLGLGLLIAVSDLLADGRAGSRS